MKNERFSVGVFGKEGSARLSRPPVPGFDYESEQPWAAAPEPSPRRRFDDAALELQTLERRGELTGLSVDRLTSIRAALYFVRVAAGVDAGRCLRAVQKGMTEWRTSADVKLQMLGLFEALSGSAGPGPSVDGE